MKRNLLTAVSAAALSLAPLSGVPMVEAQQLDDSAAAGLASLGIDTSGRMITADQAAQIENVLDSNEADDIKRAQIEEILGNEATETGRLGVEQLRDSVSTGMAQIGVDASAVETLTVTELAQLQNVLGTNDTDDAKRQQIELILTE